MQIGEHYFTITTVDGDLDLVSSPNNISITYSPLLMGYILSIRVGYFSYYWRRRQEESMRFNVRTISIVVPATEIFSYPYVKQNLEKMAIDNAKEVYSKERNVEVLLNNDVNLKLDLVRFNENKIVTKLGVGEYPDKLSTTQIIYDRICSCEDLQTIRTTYVKKLGLTDTPYITDENLGRYYYYEK